VTVEMTRTSADDILARSLADGRTLPATWYTDPATFARERARIFQRSWQYAGLAEQLARPGDFLTCRVGAVPIVIVRDTTGTLRAFINVCRHRGSELVLEGCGNRATLQCHYHAWTYNLDGSLRAAPGEKGEAQFDRDAYPLIAAGVETWGPFIFVNADATARPLAETLGELPALVTATGVRLDAVKRRVRREFTIAANWKVVVDNYLECYHCPVAHPSFSDLIDVNNYHVTEYDWFSTQTGPVKESARTGQSGPYAVSGRVDAGFYAYLWPNFMVNIYPGEGNVSLNSIQPLAVDRTLAIFEYCFVDAVSEGEAGDFVRFIDQVQDEDTVLCESVQRGLGSGYFDQGRLMLSRENGLRHFQRLVHRALAG
jgi:phenylpropionate dioxygenase-like ring-hydroxylating dioxygenase large terminal subunit